jgi:hypothetical protein
MSKTHLASFRLIAVREEEIDRLWAGRETVFAVVLAVVVVEIGLIE